MSKPKHPRALAETEAQAVLSNLRISPRKLNLVAGLIRNKPASARRWKVPLRTPRITISSMSTNWWLPAPKWAVQ
jgi:hypothetical protein